MKQHAPLSIFLIKALQKFRNAQNGVTDTGKEAWQSNHVNERYKSTKDNGGVHNRSNKHNAWRFYFKGQGGKLNAKPNQTSLVKN